MSSVNWLETPAHFKKMLAALISDQDYRWEGLKHDLSLDEPMLRQFATTQWAQKRLPDNPDILAIVTLFITYQFRWLLMDSVRLDSSVESYFQVELNVTLLLPLYIWPAYQIWVLQEFPANSHVAQSQATPWLLSQKLCLKAFKELEIPEPGEKLLAYLEVKKNTTNLSRWIKAGCDRLHFVMCMAARQTPPTADNSSDALQGLSNKHADDPDRAPLPLDQGISQPFNPTDVGVDGTDREQLNWCLASPIYQPYLQWKEALETCMDFQHDDLVTPSLCQIARKIIHNRISAAGLDLHQQAQALELLSELPEWIGIENAPDLSISLKSIEVYWRQFRNSDVSPMIKALLEVSLVQITGEDGRIRFAHPLIYDFCLSSAQVKRHHSTNPIPPRGLNLSTWLYWMVCLWLELGDSHHAGMILWNAAGALPGFNSGVWIQLGVILAHLPEAALREPHIWLLASIVREVIQYSRNLNHGTQKWVIENANFLSNHGFPQDVHQREFASMLDDYRENLKRYLSAAGNDPLYILGLALGFEPSSRNNLWVRHHALSAIRSFDPEKEVEIRLLPFVYQQKKLREVILDYARKANNWELKLAATELLVSWHVEVSKAILVEGEINNLPVEYYHRARILRHALEGVPGYLKWV
jgi:hypothetical protein